MHYRLLFSPPGQGPEIIPRHQKLEPLGHQMGAAAIRQQANAA
jgi:hypothetical protein